MPGTVDTGRDRRCEWEVPGLRKTADARRIEPGRNAFGQGHIDQLNSNLEKFLQNGQLEKRNNVIYLSDKGKIFADGIAAELFIED